jgi:hypothetical protein
MARTTLLLTMTLITAVGFAGEADRDSFSSEESALTPSDPQYWVIRSQALNELNPFLSRMRTQAGVHHTALIDYLKHIGKLDAFYASGMKAPLNPAAYAKAIGKSEEFVEKKVKLPDKPMTWNELVGLAMEFVKMEGHIPTDVAGPDEVKMIKEICEHKERYGKSLRDKLRTTAQACMSMKAYLESIDKFEACVAYTLVQNEEKARAKTAELEKRREERRNAERAKKESQSQNELQKRQVRLERAYYRRGANYGNYYRW